MTRDELEKTLFEGESTYLDWKRDFPAELLGTRGANWDTGRAKLLKAARRAATADGLRMGQCRPRRRLDPRCASLRSQLAKPPQISRNECARPSWQNSIATN